MDHMDHLEELLLMARWRRSWFLAQQVKAEGFVMARRHLKRPVRRRKGRGRTIGVLHRGR